MTPTRIPLRKLSRIERLEQWCDRHPIWVMGVLLLVTTAIMVTFMALVMEG